jgi:hypothetical protein
MSLLNNILGSAGIGNAAQGLLGGTTHQTLSEEEYVRQHLGQQYTQGLAQSMLNTQQAASQAIMQGAYGKQAKSSFDPNKEEAFQVPLSQLVTLWQARFNDTWVDMGLEHEAFWRQAWRRLNNADMFETVEGWVRLREDA